MARSPSEFYLKYLITHPDGLNNEAIRERMGELHLPCGPDKYLDRLRGRLVAPRPFHPDRPRHEPSKQFLVEEEIWGLWHPTEHTRMAMSLLGKPTPQQAVHSMMAVGADDETVAMLLDKRYGIGFSTRAAGRYRKYCWNMDLVNITELRAVCRSMAGGAPSRRDPLVLASELPATPASGMLVQMRLGFVPATMDHYKALKKVAELCTARMYEAMAMGGKEAAEEFRNCAWGLKYLSEIMDAMTAPEEDLRKMMRGVRLVTRTIQTPTVNQLTRGDFSDGSFMQAPGKEEEKKP